MVLSPPIERISPSAADRERLEPTTRMTTACDYLDEVAYLANRRAAPGPQAPRKFLNRRYL
jgi:hypothetical protein